MLQSIRLVSEAAELAAQRHSGMARKGRGNQPYINHLAEVANLLSQATSCEDAELVAAGWLHDTIEDTETTHDELARRFGLRVADLVAEVTDDMTLPRGERRQKQVEDASNRSAGAKLIKIADKISNIRARMVPAPSREELDDLVDYLGFAEKVVAGCRGESKALDQLFDETVARARGML
jgi:guanosine-3',5'-bis(diphosphate) 3'-pyrophosphohydrolase